MNEVALREKSIQLDDDKWLNFARREAALAIGRWLVGKNLLERKVRTLRIEDLDAMAEAATARMIVLASVRLLAGGKVPEEVEQILGV